MSTYLELSKTAQEQVLATIKQGQELALASVELWASSVSSLADGKQAPIAFETPGAEGSRRQLVRVRREAPRLAEGVRRAGRRRNGAGARGSRSTEVQVSACPSGPGRREPPARTADPGSDMTSPDDAWKTQQEALGSFIKGQRHLANLSLREMAKLTDVSNAYLSQIERGLHQPSVRVLRSVADALNVSAETLLAQAGLIEDDEAEAATRRPRHACPARSGRSPRSSPTRASHPSSGRRSSPCTAASRRRRIPGAAGGPAR